MERLRLLQVRNPQLACFKNYGDENLRKVLPAMLGLAVRRAFIASAMPRQENYRIESMNTLGSSSSSGRLWRRVKKNLETHDQFGRIAIADIMGLNDLVGRWDFWMERRKVVQDQRKTDDSEILPLFLRPMWCIEGEAGYSELQSGMADFFGLNELFDGLTTMPDEP